MVFFFWWWIVSVSLGAFDFHRFVVGWLVLSFCCLFVVPVLVVVVGLFSVLVDFHLLFFLWVWAR